MIQELLNSPIFGILLSIIGFEIGLYIYRKTKIALFNPLLICIALIVCILLSFNIKLDYFDKGGNFISLFLGPATVVLAVPLYKKINTIKQYAIPILLGVTVGCITAMLSIFYICKVVGLTSKLTYSLVPKSITTPIGIEVSKVLGGIPAITVAAVIITGIMGAVIAPIVCKVFKIKNHVAIGISIGTSSHALGTTKAIEMGETEGAMSSLAIGIAGLITSFLAPILIKFLC
ncbi:LrgB family protein [Clostridium botulinum]|nr:LrgB family protein [Clostridium botulinum]